MVKERALPIPTGHVQTSVNDDESFLVQRRIARAGRRARTRTCGPPHAAQQELPEGFCRSRKAALTCECKAHGDPVSDTTITLPVPAPHSLNASTKASARVTCASRFPSTLPESVRTPFTLGLWTFLHNSPAATRWRDTQLHHRHALVLSRPPAWRPRDHPEACRSRHWRQRHTGGRDRKSASAWSTASEVPPLRHRERLMGFSGLWDQDW